MHVALQPANYIYIYTRPLFLLVIVRLCSRFLPVIVINFNGSFIT